MQPTNNFVETALRNTPIVNHFLAADNDVCLPPSERKKVHQVMNFVMWFVMFIFAIEEIRLFVIMTARLYSDPSSWWQRALVYFLVNLPMFIVLMALTYHHVRRCAADIALFYVLAAVVFVSVAEYVFGDIFM